MGIMVFESGQLDNIDGFCDAFFDFGRVFESANAKAGVLGDCHPGQKAAVLEDEDVVGAGLVHFLAVEKEAPG